MPGVARGGGQSKEGAELGGKCRKISRGGGKIFPPDELSPTGEKREVVMAEPISLNVDGVTRAVEVAPDMPLLYALRNALVLNNPKFGCGLGQCGACTVIINGEAVRSCVTPVSDAAGKQIRTLQGLGTPEKPHPVQAAFIAEQVPFCGYCINGWLMTAVAMLEKNPHVSDADIREGLGNLKCRCASHMAIMRAVKLAAKSMA